MSETSTFLFAMPSFAEGAGRILDFGDTLSEFNLSLTPEQADRIAFEMDWRAISQDLRTAMMQVARERM